MLGRLEQPAKASPGGTPDADLVAVRQKVDRISIWIFKRIPLGLLVILLVYIGLRLADSSGREQWRVDAPNGKPFRTLTTSPSGVHALRSDGLCQTFDVQKGSLLWEMRLCDRFEYDAHMKASNDLLLVTSSDGLWVLDPSKGTVLFKQDDCPADPDYTLILDRRLLLVDDPNVRLSWRQWRGKSATNDQDKTSADDDAAALSCVDFASGSVSWKRPFKGRHITALAGEGTLSFCASEIPQSWEWKPCVKHQRLRMVYGQECPNCISRHIPASDKKIEAIDAATGLTRWHCKLQGGEVQRILVKTGRLLVLTSQRVYTIDADGHEVGRMPWASSNLTDTIITSDRLLGIGRQNEIRAASTAPPTPVWSSAAIGNLYGVVADDASVYVSSILKGRRQGIAAGTESPPGQEILARELWGDDNESSLGGEPMQRVLMALNAPDGRTKWRRDDMLGRIVPYGDMLLRITDGYQTALIFPDGGTVIYAHLARNGRQVWSSKVPFSMRDIALLSDRIVAIIEKHNPGMSGSGAASSSAVASFNRRSLLNRLVKP